MRYIVRRLSSLEGTLEVAVILTIVIVVLVAFALYSSNKEVPVVAPAVAAVVMEESVARAPTIFELVDVGDLEATRAVLEEKQARVGLRDESGWTPLHHAAYRDHDEVLALLLENGADVDAAAEGECVPLHMAAAENNIDAIRKLIGAGADMNIPDDMGLTALHYAALPGRHEAVRALIELGAAVNMKDAKHETPLDLAQRLDDASVATTLREAGGKSGAEVRMKDVLAELPAGKAQQRVPRAWHLEVDSPELQAATERARASMPKFLHYLSEHPDARAAVRFALREGGLVEYVWGEITEPGQPFGVEITDPPNAVAMPEAPVTVSYADVVDWQLKLEEDRTAGGYTQRATFEAIREEYGFLPQDIEDELAQLIDLD